MYVYNVGSKYFMSHTDATSNRASVSNISQATLWTLNYSNKGTTIYYNDNGTEYRVRLRQWWFGITGTRTGVYQTTDHATNLTFESSTTTNGAYKFKNDSRYLNIAPDEQAAYTAAQTASTYNDWLLISETQKETYEKYASLYQKLMGYYAADDNEDGLQPAGLKADAATVLEETKNSNYDKSATDIKKLEDLIEKYENRYYTVTVTAAAWASTCLPKATTIPEGVTVYYATKFNKEGRSVHAEPYKGTTMPANTGFLVYSDTPDAYKFYLDKTGAKPAAPEGNILYGTTVKLEGTYTTTNSVYMLANKTAGVGFYHVKEGVAITARRAYLVDLSTDAPLENDVKVVILTEEESTAISGITSADAQPTAVYDISGAQRNGMQRGLNLVKMSDGTVRKVIVK